MVAEQKTKQFLIRLSPSELDMLKQLAELAGMSGADIARQAIRREYAEKIGTFKKSKR